MDFVKGILKKRLNLLNSLKEFLFEIMYFALFTESRAQVLPLCRNLRSLFRHCIPFIILINRFET